MAGADLEAYLGVPFFRPAIDVEPGSMTSAPRPRSGGAGFRLCCLPESAGSRLAKRRQHLPLALGLGVTADIGGVVLATVSVGAAYVAELGADASLEKCCMTPRGHQSLCGCGCDQTPGGGFRLLSGGIPDALSLGGLDPSEFIDTVQSALTGGVRARQSRLDPDRVRAGFAGLLRFGPEIEPHSSRCPKARSGEPGRNPRPVGSY